MAKIIKEISCVTGQYTNKNMETKQRYQRIGSIIDTKNGPMLKLDVFPLKEGGWDGWAYINEPRNPEQFQPKPKYEGLPKDEDDFLPEF